MSTLTHPFGTLPCKDLLSISQLGGGDVQTIFDATRELKRDRGAYSELLRGKRLGMIFEKESLRTRFTFDVGMQDLVGPAGFMAPRPRPLAPPDSLRGLAR